MRLLYAYSTCDLTDGRDDPPPSPRRRRRLTAAATRATRKDGEEEDTTTGATRGRDAGRDAASLEHSKRIKRPRDKA